MFDVRKATQVAAYFLWRRGGKMSYLKLMKLMYLAEKQFLLQHGERLTGDKMVSMNRWQLVRLLHDSGFCPEWEDPQGSSYPIQSRSLLMKNGKTKEETDAILKRLEEVDDLHTITERLV